MTWLSRSSPLAAALLTIGLLGASAWAEEGVRAEEKGPAPAAAPAPTKAAPAAPTEAELALQKALLVEQGLVDALAKVRRYSVSVPIYMKNREGDLYSPGGGSGVIVSKASNVWVITNSHVVADAVAVEVVTHDGTTYPMEVEDQVAQYDIALLRFKEKPKNLKGVEVKGDVSKKLTEGSWVFATGNPFILAPDGRPVCTLGVISGTDRILPSDKFFYGNAIQHDAEVNPGNSGGPLWNSKGELIGINGKISMRSGTGDQGLRQNTGASFALPIHLVAAYLDTLVKKGDAKAGYLGVDVETYTDAATGNPAGARVTSLRPGSPAQGPDPKNSLVPNDVIQEAVFGGKPFKVLTAADLTNALVLYPAETKVSIKYKRAGKTLTWSGILGAR